MELLELTERLVKFNTVTGVSSTKDMADFISNYLESAGFRVETYPYEGDGLKNVNLIARKGDGKCALALAGHMDTVNFSGWDNKISADPLRLTFAKTQHNSSGAYYGRGVADMKFFLAVAMKAGEVIGLSELKRAFALCFTSDEEIGCLGAKKLANKVSIADNIIVGEPTEMIPVYAHKGYIYPCIELHGKDGHSSNPNSGISVLPALNRILKIISDLERKLAGIKDWRFSPPYPTVNVGVISTNGSYYDGGKKIEVISSKSALPRFCKIEMEIRPIPGQDPDAIYEVLKDSIGSIIGKVEVRFVKKRRPTPPMETLTDSSIVKITEEISGQKAVTAPYNTEAGIYNRCGAKSIVWGPGSIKQAHKEDEFVEPKYFRVEVVDAYANAIRRFCCR